MSVVFMKIIVVFKVFVANRLKSIATSVMRISKMQETDKKVIGCDKTHIGILHYQNYIDTKLL